MSPHHHGHGRFPDKLLGEGHLQPIQPSGEREWAVTYECIRAGLGMTCPPVVADSPRPLPGPHVPGLLPCFLSSSSVCVLHLSHYQSTQHRHFVFTKVIDNDSSV